MSSVAHRRNLESLMARNQPGMGRWLEDLPPGSVFETTHGTTIANLGFEDVAFPAPVFHGDSIRAQTEVISSRLSASRPSQGIVVFEHRAFNQHDVLVTRCRRSALMRCRPS